MTKAERRDLEEHNARVKEWESHEAQGVANLGELCKGFMESAMRWEQRALAAEAEVAGLKELAKEQIP